MERLWGAVKGVVEQGFEVLRSPLGERRNASVLTFQHDLSITYVAAVPWDVLEGPILRKLAPHPALALASTCTRLYRAFHLSVTELPLYAQRSTTDLHLMLFPNLKHLDVSHSVLYDQVSPQMLAQLQSAPLPFPSNSRFSIHIST